MAVDFLWTFVVQEVLKKVIILAVGQIGLTLGLKDELSKITKWLVDIEAFLRDINTRKLHHDSVRQWVQTLQHLVCEADDLLDKLVYEDLRQKVETGKLKRVRNLVSLSNNFFVFHLKMARKLKNLADLFYEHCVKASLLGLVGDVSSHTETNLSQLRETVSDLDHYEVVGRDIEVSTIVKQVIEASNEQVTSILPIVGMGGLGKTTLAKLVFNHEQIREHFDKTIWVCVSEPFVINKILEAILQTLKDTSCGLDSREILLRMLQKEMQGKRYFLVLDDVWNEDSSLWNKLKYCLMKITEKSENSIVVTTRSVEVAKIMETLPSHHLSKLSDDQCWSLFMESANAIGLLMDSNLEVVREEFIKKFGGLPLVARVLGSSIKFQGDYIGWVTSLEKVARTPLQDENSVLSILKLSVDRLPSTSLKQCFAYCSNFPKDFEFKKKQLIQMWMAQGYIDSQEGRSNITIEEIGDMYFNVLLSRCLFQDVNIRGFTSCKMHDLIHDIACAVANDQKLQDPSNLWMTNRSEKVSCKLRTIVCQGEMDIIEKVIHDKIVKFVCLRVLILNLNMIEELPNSIGKLKHLRYLDISNSSIKKLPKSIVLLYNLQTLRTSSTIECLPKNLRQLISLRHLEFLVNCFVSKKMPPHLSKLVQLQTLPCFLVGLEKGCSIRELGPLKNLKGSLELLQLNQVRSIEEARDAKLVEKENLCEIVLDWSCQRTVVEVDNHSEVLEGLEPNKNLQFLKIRNFGGKHLPNNIFVENLVSIRLSCCNNCEILPRLGSLANLKNLTISYFDGVRSINNEFYGNDFSQRTIFPKLKRFILTGMRYLNQWEEPPVASNVRTFPCLRDLIIVNCPNLLNIPNVFGYSDENDVNHLENLNISECSKLTKLPDGLQSCHSIQRLIIDGCSNLNVSLQNNNVLSSLRIHDLYRWPPELAPLTNLSSLSIHCRDKMLELPPLTNLKDMEFRGSMEDFDFTFLKHLPSLNKLRLYDSLGTTTSLPQQLEHLVALQELSIYDFHGIEVLPECLGSLTSLQYLYLCNCKNLKQLPSRETMLQLTRLHYLKVNDCQQLLLGEGHPERAKVSHVPKIDID